MVGSCEGCSVGSGVGCGEGVGVGTGVGSGVGSAVGSGVGSGDGALDDASAPVSHRSVIVGASTMLKGFADAVGYVPEVPAWIGFL